MKVFIRTYRLLPLATFVLLAALVAVSLVSPLMQVQWGGTRGGHALAAGTWTSQSSGTGQNLNGIACPSTSICFAVGAKPTSGNGTILFTDDGGSSWTSQNSNVAQNLNSIACLSTTTCFTVGDGGKIQKTTNGSSWSPLT